MLLPAQMLSALTRGNLVFAENQACLDRLSKNDLVASRVESGMLWHLPEDSSGLKILATPTGHAILYGEHGQRILYMDPGGTPLHECAWESHGDAPRLLRARLQLDWGQWVGIKPEGLINIASFDISRKPGWQHLTKQDLHRMAAQAMGVSPDEVAFFYDDEGLTLDAQGQITIRHRKDALYVLMNGTFEQARFMACMGAMRWGRIDFLPVVELFQSLLAGTGSAVFELIRGLYDDQRREGSPLVLRYRGIPTYPSPQAFQLFSTYFAAEAPGGADPFSLFMEPAHSAQVIWRPRPDVPRRFIDQERGLGVTVISGAVQKVTLRDDSAALPYMRPKAKGFPAGGRLVGATKEVLQLQDGDHREEIPLRPEWGIIKESPVPDLPISPSTWRSLFPEGAPKLDAVQAYFAVSLYPEDDMPVEELATQPLAMEQIQEYLDQLRAGGRKFSHDILIDQWDAVIAECLEAIQPRSCVALYKRAEFAQRQAQRISDHAAASGDLAKLASVSFLAADRHQEAAYAKSYELIYSWIPFERYRQRADCERSVEALSKALVTGGAAIIAGPPWLKDICSRVALRLLASDPIAGTAGVRMHRAILPKTRVDPEATLFLVQKQ